MNKKTYILYRVYRNILYIEIYYIKKYFIVLLNEYTYTNFDPFMEEQTNLILFTYFNML